MPATARPHRTSPPVNAQRATIMQVAARLQVRYHRARDLMLRGDLGPTQLHGRTLTISANALDRYAMTHGR